MVATTPMLRDQDPLDAQWTETLDRLRTFVAARVGDVATADDIIQDVIVRSIASGALARVNNPVAWLYKSARNAVIDHYRTRRSHEPIEGHEPRSDSSDQGDAGPSAATQELAQCLQPLVDGLEPIYRDAVTRVDLRGETHKQAAAEVGISVSGMKSRVQRGRRQLEERLSRCCAVHVDRTGAIAGYRRQSDACGCQTPA